MQLCDDSSTGLGTIKRRAFKDAIKSWAGTRKKWATLPQKIVRRSAKLLAPSPREFTTVEQKRAWISARKKITPGSRVRRGWSRGRGRSFRTAIKSPVIQVSPTVVKPQAPASPMVAPVVKPQAPASPMVAPVVRVKKISTKPSPRSVVKQRTIIPATTAWRGQTVVLRPAMPQFVSPPIDTRVITKTPVEKAAPVFVAEKKSLPILPIAIAAAAALFALKG